MTSVPASVPASAGSRSRASSRGSLSSKVTQGSARSSESNSSTNSDNIRVIVRCRPLSDEEKAKGEEAVLQVSGRDVVRLHMPGAVGTRTDKDFRFNLVMGPECSQNEFFETCGVKALLDSALNGYAATVFAYGQTGSGKTYSMSGYEENLAVNLQGTAATDGLIPRSMAYIFNQISSNEAPGRRRQQPPVPEYRLKASFCEIYNEQVFDLLNLQTSNLPVRWNPKRGFFVQDLYVVECTNLQDVMEVVSEGHRNRRVGSHEMNKDSSRSHSILTLHIEAESIDPEDGHRVARFGKVVFVDLAGSERLKDTKSVGVTLTETGAINKSLFTLSNVISALSSGANAGGSASSTQAQLQSHIPYRDSKLTKLLMDSLGGTSMTLMICCCSPSGSYVEETINTLKYATRAAKIKNKPTMRLDGKEQLIARLREEIKLLKMENAFLREQAGHPPNGQLASGGTGAADAAALPTIRSSTHASGPEATDEDVQTSTLVQGKGALMPPGLGLALMPKLPSGLAHHHSHLSPASSTGKTSPKAARLHAQQHSSMESGAGNSSSSSSNNNVAQDGGLNRILAGYQMEVNRLKAENRDIRTREVVAERNFHNAMVENEHLTKKLEHLEEIFVHNTNDRGDRGDVGTSRATAAPKHQQQQQQQQHQLLLQNAQLQQQVHQLQHVLAQFGSGASMQSLQQENHHLKNTVQALQHRERALLQALEAAKQQQSLHLQAHQAQHFGAPPQEEKFLFD